VVTVHCLSTFVSWPSPIVAMRSGVAAMERGKSSATVTTSASSGHSRTANSTVYASSRQVICSLSRVVSHDRSPGAAGSW